MFKYNRQSGFTLAELIVAIGVASIILAAFPVARAFLPEIRVNNAARALAQDIREARSMAVKSGSDVIVTFDLENRQIDFYADSDLDGIQISDLFRSRRLPEYGKEIIFQAVTTTGVDGQTITASVMMGNTSDPIAVTFRPNGSAVNVGVIYLRPATVQKNEMGRAVEVLSTGMVSCWRYDISGSPGPWKKWL